MPGEKAVPVCILFGPTGSGKTAVIEELFARRGAPVRAEIVSADSMQVYRGMDIGTAKPDRSLRQRLPHHLIDIRDPREQFSAGDFVRLADEACVAIARRGALPVVSGGTGFYLRNFILGLSEAPPASAALREALREALRRRGEAALREELAACDPPSAARIHPNDTYRLLRALEVFRLSGRPLSSFAPSSPDGRGGKYRFLILGLRRPREELYRRIDERCAAMFRRGLPAEVEGLCRAGYGPGDPAFAAIGYREFFVEAAPGEYALSADLEAVAALVARNSRRYAKRQITYFASLPGGRWISAGEDPAARFREALEAFLAEVPA
ncbi:MAG: tRNA (adenosine(37)-N6)-dimethylallyltransferase MiaA [Spirochaetaceae bacterium]|jgi:tRNA dimethylallyltransferase|nr:tRNA (adenosine(37)-N6)-dimethylallyltransferase MiaA [Spirochaetaceae bacterium]